MRFVALLFGVLSFLAAAFFAMTASTVLQETLGGIAAVVGTLWFVVMAVYDAGAVQVRELKNVLEDVGEAQELLVRLIDELDQVRLHAEVIRKAKEIEHKRAAKRDGK